MPLFRCLSPSLRIARCLVAAARDSLKRTWEPLKGASRTDAVLGAGVIPVHEFAEKRLLGLSRLQSQRWTA